VASRPHEPATIEQLANAMVALGLWEGQNTAAEHRKEAARLGGRDAYRLSLCNALLGAVQAQAVLADGAGGVSVEQRDAAWREQLRSAGAADDPGALMGFLRWQALRFAGPLREIAAREEAGPIPLAAAHAADGLQALLEVIGAGQNIAAADVDALPGQLRAAHQSLTNAVTNVDILRGMLDRVSADQRAFSQEDLRDVEEELLAAAVAAAPPDQPLPDSGTATLALCGALAPIADHLRQQASPSDLRPHVAELGAAAATFLIALSTPGPSLAELDNARRHLMVAVLHGSRGISRIPAHELSGEQWFLRVVTELGELMAEGSTGPPVTQAAYASRVTRRGIAVLTICAAWLAHHERSAASGT